MKVIATQDFLYSLDGSRATSFCKGEEVVCTHKIKEEMIEANYVVKAEEYNTKETPSTKVPSQEEVLVGNEDDVLTGLTQSFMVVDGMEDDFIPQLIELGIDTIEKLKSSKVKTLTKVNGIGEKTAKKILAYFNGE